MECIPTIVKLTIKLGDYSDTNMLVKGTERVARAGAVANINDKKVIFKNWSPFTDHINETSNTQVNAKDINVAMFMYVIIIWYRI